MRADLHCYTKLSHSSLGIDDLITLAQKRNIEAIAITDRDCQAGIVRARMAGERKGVTVIPGVLFSCYDSKRNSYADILCYLADSPDRLEGLCRNNLIAKKRSNQITTIKTAKRYPITPELISKCATGATAVYDHHIMHALCECGMADGFYGKVYEDLFTAESENNVLTKVSYASPEDVLNAIHESGGIAVLAHPGLYGNFDLLEELCGKGLDGVEIQTPFNSESDVETLLTFCKGKELLMTGGTEFMGMYSKNMMSVGDILTPESDVKALMNYKTKMKKRKAAAEKLNA